MHIWKSTTKNRNLSCGRKPLTKSWKNWLLSKQIMYSYLRNTALAMAVGLLFFFEALARGSATVVVPLTALYPAVAVVLSRIFLQEALTLRHLAGLALAMAAVWLLSK